MTKETPHPKQTPSDIHVQDVDIDMMKKPSKTKPKKSAKKGPHHDPSHAQIMTLTQQLNDTQALLTAAKEETLGRNIRMGAIS